MGYKVQKGDGWYKIAKNTGMDVNELLKLNNATLNTVIHPGQEIKTSKTNTNNTSNKAWAEQSNFALIPKKKQSSESMPAPYRSDYTKEQYVRDNAKSIQQQLVDAGYDLGKYGVDGKWGKVSQSALDKALADGYKLENGKLSKSSLKPRKPEAKTVQEAASDKLGEWIDNGIDTVKGWFSKSEDKAEEKPISKTTKVQSQFIPYGYSQGLVQRASKPVDETTVENFKRFNTNIVKAPMQTILDTGLYIADQAGVPSNATNYLRDLVVNIPYRTKTGIHAGVKTLFNDKSYSENYNDLLANPGFYTSNTTISPLINTEDNFSQNELKVLRDMAGNDFVIDNSDIKRVSKDGKYGSSGSVISYFSAPKVVQTAIGQSSGNPNEKVITDVFDVNTQSSEAKHDNEMYMRMAKENPGFNYETMRATMPFVNSIDIMPDKHKIKTRVKYEK